MISKQSVALVVFTYNRYEQTRLTLEALAQNLGHEQFDLYIFQDAPNPKRPQDRDKCDHVQQYLQSFVHSANFAHVFYHPSKEHRGLAASVIASIDSLFKTYDAVIVTEDDLVSHQNYLQYMYEALCKYQSDSKIWSISGYSYPQVQNANTDDVYFTFRGSSWGWATWKDRWETVDWSMRRFYTLPLFPHAFRNLNRAGKDMWWMLLNQVRGVIDSWAVRWVFQQTKTGMLTVYPAHTLLHNIGLDGSGTHGVTEGNDEFATLSSVSYTLIHPVLDAQVLNRFSSHYEDPIFKNTYQFKTSIKL